MLNFKIVLFGFIVFLQFQACSNNDDVKLRIKQLESKINKLEKENHKKNAEIQELMSELSECKASKIKYIDNSSENYKIIKENNKSVVDRVPIMDDNLKKNTKKDIKSEFLSDNNSKKNTKKDTKSEFLFAPPDSIEGNCKKSDIKRVFHNLKPYYKKCFESFNVKSGMIGFSWIVNKDGEVENVRVVKNNIYNKNLTLCLKKLIKKGRYNSPKDGICKIEYIFKR